MANAEINATGASSRDLLDMDKRETLKMLAAEAQRGELTFPTSAAVALRVRQELDDPDCHTDTATRLIQTEPLLAARVVAVANSAAFNRSGREVTDVGTAVTQLGFRMVRTLATAVIARQMVGVMDVPAHRDLAAQLWEHTAHTAALARMIARRIMRQDPETAMFAGLVHEIGGFYLLSRAKDFPGLIDGGPGDWMVDDDTEEDTLESTTESEIGRAVLKALSVPEPVVAAIEVLWKGYLAFPPSTLGDTLLLADQLSPVKSPLLQTRDDNRDAIAATIDMIIGQETLVGILEDSAEEVQSMTAALRF
jgi:HD-like signal output (HDOD) protein